MSQISKTIAVSTLGLYAGILSTSALVKIASPRDIIPSEIKHIYCILGIGNTIVGTLTTAAFGISYLLSTRCCCSTYLLYGMLVAPATGAYLWLVDKLQTKLPLVRNTPKLEENKEAENTENTKPEIDLPPSHPPIVSESGEKLTCPFASGESTTASATKHTVCNTKKLFCQINGKFVNHLSEVVKDMTPHLITASIGAVATFTTIVYKRMK